MNAAQPKETLLDLINAGDTERLGDFFYTSAAKAKGIVKVRPVDIGWEDYTLTPDKFEPAETDPADMDEAMRWCVIVDDIPECEADTKAHMYLDRETGDMIIAALSGPAHDHDVAIRMVARDLKAEQASAPTRKAVVIKGEAGPRKAANDNTPPNGKHGKFTITRFRDLGKAKAKPSVVKGLRFAGEASYTVAKPGGGKSALETDIAYHIASGRDWHGHKVEQGLAVYFAAERKALQDRRVMAYRRFFGDDDIPFVVVGGKPDLTHPGRVDALEMVKIVKALEVEYGVPCRLITIDTLARTFGGKNQNATEDMSRYVFNIDLLMDRVTTAHTSVIHHEGWDTGRAKGSIDLDGAVDVSFRIIKTGDTFKLICDGANDGIEGDVLSFAMQSVELGVDEDGEPITAPVIVPAADAAGDQVKATETKQAKAEADAMDILLELSAGGHSVGGGMWLARFRETEPDANERTVQSRWHRAVKALEKAGRVTSCGSPKVYTLTEMQE
ncbi:AAA family ATPase [Mesorhizobium sp. WSM3876]|uniref:AAA family ATPase n=1 Tax=Mesorhizobium sp. WSM3876 TaxID=422277 RepID=UPI001596EFC4|nr:AAA family ATPase [Mesorhizobium sp. WSM3876]